jgi:signal transduction histidine kinase/phage shock protein PspC (stress-responsive transcriptional regulator)
MVPPTDWRDHGFIPDSYQIPDPPAAPPDGETPRHGPRPFGPGRGWARGHRYGERQGSQERRAHWDAQRQRHAERHAERRRVQGPLRRRTEDRLLGGIATGLSAKTGFDVTVIRIGLVLFSLVSGIGLAAYVVAWLLIPVAGEPESIGARAVRDGRGLALAVALFPALVLSLLIASALDAGWLGSLAWPLFIAAAGMALIWRNGSEEERALIRRATTPLAHIGSGIGRSPRGLAGLAGRLTIGLLLAATAVATLTTGRHREIFRPLAGVVLVLAAFVVVFGPWWLSVARDLVSERQSRLRAEQAADLAAQVHDSVLQTLAMVQRHADDPQRVAQLARAQERELRSWLFEGRSPGAFDEELHTVAAVVRRIQSDVEAAHGAPIEAVVVGDGPLSSELEVLLAAGREAVVNAAKWSGADVVSLFVEVEDETVSLYVRDRGRGFDPSSVAPDRRGIAQSIKGRIDRSGGTASLRSAPGAGTEVKLTMPRKPAAAPRHHAR